MNMKALKSGLSFPVNESASFSPERQTVRRITLHLIPFMFILYIVAYLDRVNVGFAALQMNAELRLSHAVFGLGGGIFFVGYFLCAWPWQPPAFCFPSSPIALSAASPAWD